MIGATENPQRIAEFNGVEMSREFYFKGDRVLTLLFSAEVLKQHNVLDN